MVAWRPKCRWAGEATGKEHGCEPLSLNPRDHLTTTRGARLCLRLLLVLGRGRAYRGRLALLLGVSPRFLVLQEPRFPSFFSARRLDPSPHSSRRVSCCMPPPTSKRQVRYHQLVVAVSPDNEAVVSSLVLSPFERNDESSPVPMAEGRPILFRGRRDTRARQQRQAGRSRLAGSCSILMRAGRPGQAHRFVLP